MQYLNELINLYLIKQNLYTFRTEIPVESIALFNTMCYNDEVYEGDSS